MNLLVIDNAYDGIGDAVMYCWIINSARAAGLDAKLNIRQHHEVAWIFGQEAGLTIQPGERYFSDKGDGSDHYRYETHGDGKGMMRFDAWCAALGLGQLKAIRPPYIEHPRLAEWADQHWESRVGAGSPRIVIFPECAWPNRTWPRPCWVDLAWMLHNAGCSTVVVTPRDNWNGAVPHCIWGHKLAQAAALIARADLVIGNDSGPAHIAGTIGTPTIAVCGATRPEIVFGHVPEVRGVTGTMECTGCSFRAPYRAACSAGCQSLYRLTPQEVYTEARNVLSQTARQCEPVEHRRSPADDAAARAGCGAQCAEV